MVAAQPSILCDGVGKTFLIRDERFAWRVILGLPIDGKTFHALKDVSLLVPKGKIVGILGRNGAGKSTLLRIVAGVSRPNSGLVRLGGDTASLFELGGMGSRFITGRDFAKRFLQLQGTDRHEIARLIREIAEFSELEGYFDRRIVTYSSGMAARLYFSTATARQSEIYLIDEVLSVGDAHFVAKCWARLRARLAQGASGLLVTHDWSAALKLCEQSHVLDGGRITQSGPTDQVIVNYLNLPKPQVPGARFLLSGDQEFSLDSGKSAELRVPVEVSRQVDIFLGFSIELMRIGFGWEVMLLSNLGPLNASVGRHDLILRVPNLPLAPGQYILNLFLRSQTQSNSQSKDQPELNDARSWTYGNGIKLKVVGRSLSSCLQIPMKWELH